MEETFLQDAKKSNEKKQIDFCDKCERIERERRSGNKRGRGTVENGRASRIKREMVTRVSMSVSRASASIYLATFFPGARDTCYSLQIFSQYSQLARCFGNECCESRNLTIKYTGRLERLTDDLPEPECACRTYKYRGECRLGNVSPRQFVLSFLRADPPIFSLSSLPFFSARADDSTATNYVPSLVRAFSTNL